MIPFLVITQKAIWGFIKKKKKDALRIIKFFKLFETDLVYKFKFLINISSFKSETKIMSEEVVSLVNEINNYLNLVAAISLSTIGLIGNIMILLILTKRKFRNVSIFRYSIVSAVNDTLVLATMWPFCLPNGFHMNTYSINCKLIQYFGYLFYQFCPWIIVVSAIDRLLSVKYPTRFLFRTKIRFQATILSSIFITLVLIDIPFYMVYDIQVNGNETYCGSSDIKSQFYIDISSSLISTIIPFASMIFSTTIIGHHFLIKKKQLQQNRKRWHNEVQLVKILLAMNCFFFICNLPFCIQQLTFDGLAINNQTYFYQLFVYNLTNNLIYVHNAFSFFLYLSCNKLFRNHFLVMIGCKNAVGPIETTFGVSNLT